MALKRTATKKAAAAPKKRAVKELVLSVPKKGKTGTTTRRKSAKQTTSKIPEVLERLNDPETLARVVKALATIDGMDTATASLASETKPTLQDGIADSPPHPFALPAPFLMPADYATTITAIQAEMTNALIKTHAALGAIMQLVGHVRGVPVEVEKELDGFLSVNMNSGVLNVQHDLTVYAFKLANKLEEQTLVLLSHI